MKKSILALAVLILMFATVAAFADDLNPPSWRGTEGTTWATWEFSTSNPVTTPDQYYNPYGTPTAHAYPGTGQAWQDSWGGRQGIWPLSGTIEVTIPNSPTPNPAKWIWVQLTWAKQVTSSTPVVWEMNSGIQGTLINQTVLGPTGYGSPNDLWYHSTYQITLNSNPTSEIVKIDGTLMVDELVIDTKCVPEPASLLALSCGLAGVIWRKRR